MTFWNRRKYDGRIVLTMRKKFSVHKSGNTGTFGSGKSGTIQNFNYEKNKSIIAIFQIAWYNQNIKGATATQGG